MHLRKLPHLEEIDLQATPLTDAGLEHIAAILSLRQINLAATGISEQGQAKLKEMRLDLNLLR